jgi:hypothetical protein
VRTVLDSANRIAFMSMTGVFMAASLKPQQFRAYLTLEAPVPNLTLAVQP